MDNTNNKLIAFDSGRDEYIYIHPLILNMSDVNYERNLQLLNENLEYLNPSRFKIIPQEKSDHIIKYQKVNWGDAEYQISTEAKVFFGVSGMVILSSLLILISLVGLFLSICGGMSHTTQSEPTNPDVFLYLFFAFSVFILFVPALIRQFSKPKLAKQKMLFLLLFLNKDGSLNHSYFKQTSSSLSYEANTLIDSLMNDYDKHGHSIDIVVKT